jgi:hypothetical protein
MENIGIFYVHLEYITVILYFLLSFGNFVVIRYIFSRFGILCQEKSGHPDGIAFIINSEIVNTIKSMFNVCMYICVNLASSHLRTYGT